jgi:hypothetical protein
VGSHIPEEKVCIQRVLPLQFDLKLASLLFPQRLHRDQVLIVPTMMFTRRVAEVPGHQRSTGPEKATLNDLPKMRSVDVFPAKIRRVGGVRWSGRRRKVNRLTRQPARVT